jgi:hypothetical protein
MTNQKICDKCKEVIKPKTDYIKLQLIKHENKALKYLGVGHLCLNCFMTDILPGFPGIAFLKINK